MAPVGVRNVAGPAPVPGFGSAPRVSGRPTVVQSLGSGNPSGSSISIAATPNGANVGDLVVVAFAWAVGTVALSTVTDTSGNTWTVVSTPAPANESGGYGYTIVTTGWASGANTVTGTLASGAPGGRTWAAASIPAVYNPVVDQHVESSVTALQPSVSTGTLSQATESCILVEILRTSAAVPAFLWLNDFQGVSSATGVATLTSGVGIASYDNLTGLTNPVTGAVASEKPSNDSTGLGILAVAVTTGSVVNQTVNAPLATASASALVPAVQLEVDPAVATASASAPIPTVQLQVSPAAATATASSPVPVPKLEVDPSAATASASALVPAVSVGQTVFPPVATASATAPVPTIQVQVPPPAATASASAPTPGIQIQVLSPAATAAASAPIPAVQIKLTPAVATASASALIPGIQLRVSPGVASAAASALLPTVSGSQTVSPPAATAAASARAPSMPVVAPTAGRADLQFGAIILLPSGLTTLQTVAPAFIAQTGLLPSYWTVYRSWPTALQFSGYAIETYITGNLGATPVLAWEPNVTCAGVVDGTHDTYINNQAALAAAYGKPLYVRFMYEFNGGWETYGVKNQPAGNSYAQFVTAWKYVVDKFRAAGANNVKWVWNPNVDDGTLPFDACYPGDSYVDIVALDGYNQDFPWQHPSDVFDSSLADITALAPTKPVWIAEVGTVPTNGANTKSQWYTDLATYAKQHPVITALHYFDSVGPHGDMTIDSSGSDGAAVSSFVSAITTLISNVSASASALIPSVVAGQAARVVSWAIAGAWGSSWGFKPNASESSTPLEIHVPPQPAEPLR